MNHIQQAIQFRKIYMQPIRSRLLYLKSIEPAFLALTMQMGCIEEEKAELAEAVSTWVASSNANSESTAEDKLHVIKELADLVYVCYQLAAFLGIDIDEALDRVHESNMSKLDENGQPIYNESGKVMKGPNYKEPDLSDLV